MNNDTTQFYVLRAAQRFAQPVFTLVPPSGPYSSRPSRTLYDATQFTTLFSAIAARDRGNEQHPVCNYEIVLVTRVHGKPTLKITAKSRLDAAKPCIVASVEPGFTCYLSKSGFPPTQVLDEAHIFSDLSDVLLYMEKRSDGGVFAREPKVFNVERVTDAPQDTLTVLP